MSLSEKAREDSCAEPETLAARRGIRQPSARRPVRRTARPRSLGAMAQMAPTSPHQLPDAHRAEAEAALDVLLDAGLDPIVDMVCTARDGAYEALTHDGRVTFRRHDDGTFERTSVEGRDPLADQSTAKFTPGQWNHLAAVRDGANMRIYLNGAQVATLATATGSLPATATSRNTREGTVWRGRPPART